MIIQRIKKSEQLFGENVDAFFKLERNSTINFRSAHATVLSQSPIVRLERLITRQGLTNCELLNSVASNTF